MVMRRKSKGKAAGGKGRDGRDDAQHWKARGAGGPMQMGPASLPTPLSPMRGHVRRRALGIRCFAILLRRGAEFKVCHRRSHRHPDPPSGGFSRGRSGPKPSLPSHTPPSTGGSAVGCSCRSLKRLRFVRSEDLSKRPLGRRPGNPARGGTPSHFLQRFPCVRPKPSARGHSRCERTDPAASSRFGNSPKIFRWLDLRSRLGSAPFR